MRLFRDRAGVSPSYIHDIEQGTTIPSVEKLKAITAVLREVAEEQSAVDPDAEGRALYRAREETMYIDRLHLDPRLARIFVALGELNEDSLAKIDEPMLRAIGFFSRLESQLQHGVSEALLKAMAVVDQLEFEERNDAGMKIATALNDVIESIQAKPEPGDAGVGSDVGKGAPMSAGPRTRVRAHQPTS